MSPSPIRCRGPWKIHKRSSEPDRWLDEMGFFRKHTARDSSCLFRAVSENIYNTQRYFHKVRLDCVQFMASKRHLFEGVGLNDHYLNFNSSLIKAQPKYKFLCCSLWLVHSKTISKRCQTRQNGEGSLKYLLWAIFIGKKIPDNLNNWFMSVVLLVFTFQMCPWTLQARFCYIWGQQGPTD